MLAGVYDNTNAGASMQAQRPKIKKSEIPKRLIRPWSKSKDVEKLGNTPRPLDDLNKLLGW